MTSQTVKLICPTTNQRLDKLLAASIPNLSRTQARRLIETGQVSAAGLDLKPNTMLAPGVEITVILPEPETVELVAQNIPLDILFEDAHLVALNKPTGLVVHPAAGHKQETLVNALLNRYPDLAGLHPSRPGIVHRLDKETSGVMVVGRTQAALENLQAQLKSRQVEKIYLALTHGRLKTQTGLIDVPLGRHPQHRQRRAALPEGKPARTHFQVLETFNNHSLLQLRLETGRTHQIRVHLAWLGHPVVGDSLYGRKREGIPIARQFLHANRLAVDHPHSGQRLTFAAPIPSDLAVLLELLRQSS